MSHLVAFRFGFYIQSALEVQAMYKEAVILFTDLACGQSWAPGMFYQM